MKIKTKKYSLLKLGFLIGSIASIFIASSAQAGFMNTQLVRCSEDVVPYSSNGRIIENNDYTNSLSAGDCEAHAPLTEHYQDQTRLKAEHSLPNKPDIDKVKAPYARHFHNYTFDATSQGITEDKIYSSQVYEFKITLHPDTVKNTDMSKLNCDFPLHESQRNNPNLAQWTAELQDCNGNVTDQNLWGGLKITTTDGANGTKIVTYTFDTGDHNKMPTFYGLFDTASRDRIAKVDAAIAALQPGNPTEQNTRDVRTLGGTHVRLVSKDKTPTDEIWTATTTSEVLLVDWAIPKDSIETNWSKNCYEDDDNATTGTLTDKNSWCVVSPQNVGSTKYPIRTIPGSDRYWYSIGTVVTAWQAPVKPPVGPVCEVLKLSKTVLENGNICATIDKGTFTGDLEWTLNTENKDAILDIGMVGEGANRKRITGKNVKTSVDTTRQINGACATIRNLKEEDTVNLSVKAVGAQGGTCSAGLAKTPPPPKKLVCESLEFTKRPSTTNFIPGEYCVKANPNNSYTGPMKFSITGKGSFAKAPSTVLDGNLIDPSKPSLVTPVSPTVLDTVASNPSLSGTTTLQILGDNPSRTVDRKSNGEWCTTVTGVGDNATIDIVPTADADAAKVCKLNMKNTPTTTPVCEELTLTPTGELKDGEYCVAITKGSFTGDLQWKIKNGDVIVDLREYSETKTKIDSTKDNKSCVTINVYEHEPETEVTVTAVGSPQCQATRKTTPPPPLVCQSLEFTKRPNGTTLTPGEYCVKANPADSYKGQMRFWIEGQGAFKTTEPAKINENIINGPVYGAATLNQPLVMELAPEFRPKDPFYGGFYTLDPNFLSKDPQTIVTRRDNGEWCATITSVGDNAKFNVAPTDVEAAKVCHLDMTKSTEKPVCEKLKLTPPGELNDGNYCVSVERGKFKGNIKWTITGGDITEGNAQVKTTTTTIDSEGSNQSCIQLNEDEAATSTLTVAAENEPDCIASANDTPPGGNVCIDTRWTRRANFRTPAKQLICVRSQTSNNARYNSGYQWQVDGPGGFLDKDDNKVGKITSTTIETGDEDCIYVEGLERSSRIFVQGLNKEPACSEFDRDVVLPPPPDKPPVIRKGVKNIRSATYGQRTSVPNKDAEPNDRERIVEYQVSYEFNSPEPVVVTIRDEIGEGNKGQLIGTKGGTVDYIETKMISHKGTPVPRCDIGVATDRVCYTGNIANERGVTVYNATGDILIVYTAQVNSAITDEECKKIRTNQDCAERFFNRAFGETVGHENGVMVRKYRRVSEDTEVLVSCRFFLTRAGGDVFFEEEFNTGVDTQFCGRRNTTGIIIKRLPTPEGKLPKTGTDQNFAFSHKVCQLSAIPIKVPEGQDPNAKFEINESDIPPVYREYLSDINELPSTYQDPIKNFSSLICEIQLATASNLNKEFVQGTMQENVTRIARWNKNLDQFQGAIPTTIFESKDQIFRQSSTVKTPAKLSGLNISPDMGAKTIIIEGQDLIIDKNITYPTLSTITNPRSVPSLAIIVLGGDIVINPDVTQIDAILFTQQDTTTGKGGRITSKDNANSSKQLKINGSIFGDIRPLFETRNYAGDPKKDEGAIVIRYDERIILNTPPGLQEVIDINQLEVARGS